MKKILLTIGFLLFFISVNAQIGRFPFSRYFPPAEEGSSLTTGIIGFWPADESEGTTLTDAVSTNNFTTLNITWSSGMVFDNTTDRARSSGNVAAFADLGDEFTIALWATLTSTPNSGGRDYYFWAQNNGEAPYRTYCLWGEQSDNKLYFSVNTAGGEVIAEGSALAASTLYHIVATYNGSTLKLYINNSDVTAAPAAQSGNIIVGDDYTYVGNRDGTNCGPNGTLRTIGLWGKCLSSD